MFIKLYTLVFCLLLSISVSAQTGRQAGFSNVSINKWGKITWTVSYYGNPHSLTVLLEKLNDQKKWVEVMCALCHINSISVENSADTREPGTEPKTLPWISQVKFHKGINTFRLRMVSPQQVTSEEFTLNSQVSNDDGSLWIMDNIMYLDQKEKYEILDNVGKTLLKGESDTINLSSLPPGSYWYYTKKVSRPFSK